MELLRSPNLWSGFLENNGYILHHCIGAGSFGDVFAITKTTTHMKCALKRIVVRGKVTDDKYAMSEVNALMMFDHPNIVALKEFFTCESLACIILELAPGGNLEMMVLDRCHDVSDAFIRVSFRQLISAVDYCHGLNFAHRDINPSNILIFNDNLVKLADFGLCFRCCDEETEKDILCTDYLGQNAFLAPEVKLHKPFQSKPADVWSLGCVLFFMVKRVNPPTNETDYLKLVETSVILLSSLNDRRKSQTIFINIIKKTCASNPTERPELARLVSIWNL